MHVYDNHPRHVPYHIIHSFKLSECRMSYLTSKHGQKKFELAKRTTPAMSLGFWLNNQKVKFANMQILLKL